MSSIETKRVDESETQIPVVIESKETTGDMNAITSHLISDHKNDITTDKSQNCVDLGHESGHQLNASLSNTQNDTNGSELERNANEPQVELIRESDEKVNHQMTNGSDVVSKLTRNKRNSAQQLIMNTTNTTKPEDNQKTANSEQRLTRSRYGRLQKAKTQNPEMITFNVKRRSSLKNSDINESPMPETSLKASITCNTESVENNENKQTNDELDTKSKPKRRTTSGSPRNTGKRKRANKLDSVIDQIKSKPSDTESTRPNAQNRSSKKKQTNKDSVPQKKCIELTGDTSSSIVDRSFLTSIPAKQGEYGVGDLIWAKVHGYPFWPCMVSIDPITAIYSKISGMSYKADRVYHVQYFGPQALRGWTSVGMIMPFEGKDKYLEKLEHMKSTSPKGQAAKIAAKYAIKPSLKKQWDQSVDEAEEASKVNVEDRVKSLTFEYILSSKLNLRRKSDTSLASDSDAKRKKLSASPEDIYDFDDNDSDNVNISQSTPGLMWRKRVQKGDFASYAKQNYTSMKAENPGANKEQINEMLQKRWDLLSDDLRALYMDRKSIANNELNSSSALNTKTNSAKKTTSDSTKPKTKSNGIKKQKPKLTSNENHLEQNDSNGSDSEGNLVIAETPIKRTPVKKKTKSEVKKGLDLSSATPSASAKKSSNTIKEITELNTPQVIKSPKKANVKPSNAKSRKSSVTPNKKKVEENNKSTIAEKAHILHPTDQSLVQLGIDYLDEFLSSEETSSTSEPEAGDGPKAIIDKFCALCPDEESETLLSCQGSCLQKFHRKCAKYEGIENQFKCNECESGNHSCFVCKKLENASNEKTLKCNDSKCGKFYHISCLEKNFPVKFNESKTSFVCPLHSCLNCHIESQNDKDFRPSRRRLVKCTTCPTAYHLGDYCIAAGTITVSQNYVICPDHFECSKKKKTDKHLNVNYCFSCLSGGQLICCESCPAAFHVECLDWVPDQTSMFYCSDCTSRKQLHYGDIVWVKLGFYRWWPGKVSHPKLVPDNVMKLKHGVGEFPVYFFGSHDYYWVHRGRVFLFMEGDNKVVAANGGGKKSNKSLMKTFKLAMEEAADQYKHSQESKITLRRAMITSKPPPYVHIRSNKPVGPKVQIATSDDSQISLCECKDTNDSSCSDENCINRALMVECDPKHCPAKDKCKNQRFKKREYALSKPFKTESAGWGLKSLVDISKGQFVIEYVGELIDEEECERRLKMMADNNQSNFYFLTIDKDKIIDAGPKGNLARFMNHSCQPNCETQKWMVNGATRVGLFAVCDIPTGTELTFNYNLDCRGNEKTKCVCGSTNCPGFIGVRPNKAEDNQTKKSANNGSNHKKKRKKQKDFNKMHDDECFTCGEGGDLIMCDRKGCPKSYHLECLKLPQIPKGKWECPRHFCDSCGKAATAMCSFCPNSLCKEHAVPSKLTQLPDGGLLCSDHVNEEVNGVLMEPEVNSVNDSQIETMRKDETESATEETTGDETGLEMSGSCDSQPLDTSTHDNELESESFTSQSILNL